MMGAKLPAISPRSQKTGCDLPAISPCNSPRSPRDLGCETPSLPKGREYSVPPSGVRHKPVLVSDQLHALAGRVLRLMVSHRDPERFFVERSDIADEMRRLARAVR